MRAMEFPTRRRIKKWLNSRLIYYPLLRMLLFKVYFRVVFMTFLVMGLFLLLYLPKMWQTSPEGFNPLIKVSWLDMTQAWSLKRTARGAAAEGDRAKANYSWQAAIANNPADAQAIRGFINNLVQTDNPDQRSAMVSVAESLFLLRLANTNSADLELCTRLYEKLRSYDVLFYVFEPLADKLTGRPELAYTKALFHLGRKDEFEQRLKKISAENRADKELELYKLAHAAAWGTGPDSTEALQKLIASRKDPETKIMAHRLYMLVCAKRTDALGYADSLQALEQINQSSVFDHVTYWKVLNDAGRREEAIKLAESFTTSPQSAMETIRLAEVYYMFGLTVQAREILGRFAPTFGHSPEIWATYASLLEEDKDWERMRAAALQIRNLQGVRDVLGGFGYYLEGRAELGQQRIGTAESAFKKAAEATYEIAGIGLLVGRELSRLDFPGYARQILKPLENALKWKFEYWENCFQAGFKLKDAEWILKSAAETYRAKPKDPAMLNRYVATLILNRAKAEEAIKLSLELLNAYPASVAARINHSVALLLNNRTQEARKLLLEMDPHSLKADERASYQLAWFEIYLNSKQMAEAWKSADQIDRSKLFPNQVQWLEKKITELPPRITKS
jgi:hypothetical protein